MSIAHVLADLAVNTAGTAISRSGRDAATRMLLDTCACAFCGMDAPGVPELVGLESELSAAGAGSVFFTGRKLALPSAVLCNAAMIHALDFDNNYPAADIHILCIVVPVAFACAEETGADGRDCLAAMILGVEAASRIAKPYMRASRSHEYFLTTSLVGGWGGVATAARLLGLSAEQTVHAMGIYYAQTCGNRQALLERALTKRIQPAIAAKAAVYSVLLAERGITGPEHTFEGPGGFFRCYTQDPPPAEKDFVVPSLGAIEELTVKHFPTCGIHHANIASAIRLKREHGFACDEIERAEFYLREGGQTLVSMPFIPGSVPQVAAQFCAPYAIALALSRGEVAIRDFNTSRILADRETADLARRTKEHTRFADMGLRHYPHPKPGCRYTKVILRDGRVLEHESPSAPLNDPASMGLDQIREKFRQCVGMYGEVDPAAADAMADAILAIESAAPVSDLIASILGNVPPYRTGPRPEGVRR